MLEQISKLEEALYNIQFEQHWLEAQTERQAIGIFTLTFLFLIKTILANVLSLMALELICDYHLQTHWYQKPLP